MYKPRLPDAPAEYDPQWASDLIRTLQQLIDGLPTFPANRLRTGNLTISEIIQSLVEAGVLHNKDV